MIKKERKTRKKVDPKEIEAKMTRFKFAFLELKYEKEKKMGKLNEPKLQVALRNILREAKLSDLYHEVEILSQAFERIVDRKDYVIKKLTEDIKLAEDQHHLALSGHLEQITRFIEIQQNRLDVLKKDFNHNKNDLLQDFNSQHNKLQKTYDNDMDKMADLGYALETLYLGVENQYKSDFRSRVDEIRNKNADDRQIMRFQLEHQLEQTWIQMHNTLQEYNENTEQRRKAYNVLLDKDQKNGETINHQMDMIQSTAGTIANLKLKIADQMNKHENKTKSLVDDRQRMKKHFMELKTHLKKVNRQHEELLITLSTTTTNVLGEMSNMITQAEKIIRLGEMCAKYETEEEKILPFYESSLTDDDLKEVEEMQEQPFQEPLAALLDDYKGLENFWKRFNKVYLDKLCLEREQATLVAKNERICHMLRQYLENITVHEDTVSKPENTLLMINTEIKLHFQAIPTTDTRVKRQAQSAIQDAAYIFQQSKMSA